MIRIRALVALLLTCLAGMVSAQDAPAQAPLLRMDFPETETIPGQPLSLRLTVLVPTFLPSPPVWPNFDAPNLMVRLPERSTGPVSERIGSETWSGVSRHYRISPLVAGQFTLPPQEVIVTWSDPATDTPVKVTLTTDPFEFTGTVPEGAEGLDPFIAATELSLTQAIDGDPAAMAAGDSFTRMVTAQLHGAPPMVLPQLLAPADLPGLAAYPEDPVLSDTDDRGVPGGTRVEKMTYVAEGGGGGTLPALSVDWFNTETGQVETAVADAVEVQVAGPPPVSAEPRDWRLWVAVGLGALVVALAGAWGLRRVLPPLRRVIAARRARALASERHAWGLLHHAVSKRDRVALHPALDLWAGRVPDRDPRRDASVQAALLALGAARYGPAGGSREDSAAWADLDKALRAARRDRSQRDPGQALPPLNPTG